MKPGPALYANITVTKNDRSEVEVSGEIPQDAIEHIRPTAIKHLGEHIKLPGFRAGHIPESTIIREVGETAILEEIAERALKEIYPKIIEEHALDVIGRPEVTITKLAPGNPISFKINAAVVPTVELPDYKSIAQATPVEPPKEITDEDLETFISKLTKPKEGEEPVVLTDELVKQWGDFTDVSDFRVKLKKELERDRERSAKEKRRISIADQIIEKSNIPLPRVLVESEIEKMLGQFKEDVKRMGSDFPAYLKQINKTEEDLKKDWQGDAEKRAKLQLILNHIAERESIRPEASTVEAEVKHLEEHVPDADPDRIRIYVATMLTNEKVFDFLENQKA